MKFITACEAMQKLPEPDLAYDVRVRKGFIISSSKLEFLVEFYAADIRPGQGFMVALDSCPI